MKKLVYIILVNYNGYKDTIECVRSLRKITYSNYKVVIVDNSSTNNSEEILREHLKDCHIIQSGSNLGFSGGNNIGIKYAMDNGADYVLLLNNDTIVKEDFLVNLIVEVEKDNSIGVVGGKILYYPEIKKVWFGGGKINTFKFIGENLGMMDDDSSLYNTRKEITFMTGCCMLIKWEVIEKVGYLDDDYFMYFEDVDFCYRVLKQNYKIIYQPSSIIYHKVSAASGGELSPFSIEWMTRNRIVYMKKFQKDFSKIHMLLSKSFFYLTRIPKLVYYYRKNKVIYSAIIAGIKSGRKYRLN